jgi:hypothetical protein
LDEESEKILPKFEYCPFCGVKCELTFLLAADHTSDGIKRYIYNVEHLYGCGKSFDIWVAEV